MQRVKRTADSILAGAALHLCFPLTTMAAFPLFNFVSSPFCRQQHPHSTGVVFRFFSKECGSIKQSMYGGRGSGAGKWRRQETDAAPSFFSRFRRSFGFYEGFAFFYRNTRCTCIDVNAIRLQHRCTQKFL